ncbi:hypothetical protein [Rickettsiales endosymbiont of Stachyamoeba lipophora]|uniref:hypothetical protein n=1 Tax=Rickettsiales endosymbiont of Stachyamoeba lipophora TaxID=2486578 RepID=UPI000F64D5DB|nr:hypothetical protein [Rickettsiales endosymbiont of Stachyamoeba lipophora]AZL15918.1 hypothetical protein EF513_05105 [Rickettsiales endosymbiont of Stachyamoeba lipophora]
MLTLSPLKNKLENVRHYKPDFFNLFNLLTREQIVLKSHHFWLFSIAFHLIIIVPIFFEIFIHHKIIDNKPLENIVYLNYLSIPSENEASNKKLNETIKTSTKNPRNLISEQSDKIQQSSKEILKNYEDQLTNQVGMVLEKHVDAYQVNGKFILQFTLNKDGDIENIILAEESEDEISNQNLIKILKHLHKFLPIPMHFPKDYHYHFHIPVEIEQ